MTRWTRVRIAVCGVVLLVLFVPVGQRAFNLQVREADRLRAMAEEQYLRESSCRRGAGASSTATAPSWPRPPTSTLSTATRASCPTRATRRARLARVLGIDARELEKKLGAAAVLRLGEAQGHAGRGRGGQGAGAAGRGVHARAAALLSEPRRWRRR